MHRPTQRGVRPATATAYCPWWGPVKEALQPDLLPASHGDSCAPDSWSSAPQQTEPYDRAYSMSFVRLYLHSRRVGRNILWTVKCECGMRSDGHWSERRARNEGKRHLVDAHPRQTYVFKKDTDEMT